MTHAERLEVAVRERRVTWLPYGPQRQLRLTVPADGATPPRWGAIERRLTDAERRAFRKLKVRYMRRRDDAPGSSGGIVLMAE